MNLTLNRTDHNAALEGLLNNEVCDQRRHGSDHDQAVTDLVKTLLRLLLGLCVGLLLANLLQVVYNMADMVIVGQVMGSVGLSAVSIGGDRDTIAAIAGSIAEQMKAQTAANPENTFWLDDEEMPDFDLAEMVKDADFFVNAQNEVVISFDEGDVAPMSSGMVQFTIPTDVLADIRVAL